MRWSDERRTKERARAEGGPAADVDVSRADTGWWHGWFGGDGGGGDSGDAGCGSGDGGGDGSCGGD